MSNDSRRVRRGHLIDHDRVLELEDDLDKADSEIHRFRQEVADEFKWIRRTLIGFLLTLPVATIGICVTIVLAR